MLNTIKNIIFDLGGILLNIDYGLTISAFKKLGMEDFDGFFTQAAQHKVFDRFDTGHVTPGEFRDRLRKLSGLHLSDSQIDDAWNAMLLDMPEDRLHLLEKVRRHYRTFLLSNTNAIHYPVYTRYMKEVHGIHSLEALFEKHYLSHEIGMRKPDKAVFELVLKENGLHPGETLFVDDSRQHVYGAREAGLKALWLNVSKNTIHSIFNDEGRLKGVVRKMTAG